MKGDVDVVVKTVARLADIGDGYDVNTISTRPGDVEHDVNKMVIVTNKAIHVVGIDPFAIVNRGFIVSSEANGIPSIPIYVHV
jgi:hypothetical protein